MGEGGLIADGEQIVIRYETDANYGRMCVEGMGNRNGRVIIQLAVDERERERGMEFAK